MWAFLQPRYVRQFAAERAGESVELFERGFQAQHVDPRIVRAAYEVLCDFAGFPIRATDHLAKDLRVDDEDRVLSAIPEIVRLAGRSLKHHERIFTDTETVAGVIAFVSTQPLNGESET
jgi:hypothetical protein